MDRKSKKKKVVVDAEDPWGNPRIIGPGIWAVLFLMAIDAQDDTRRVFLIRFLNEVLRRLFPCHTCREHLAQQLDNVNMVDYTRDEGNISLVADKPMHLGMFYLIFRLKVGADTFASRSTHTKYTPPDINGVLQRVLKLHNSQCSSVVCMQQL